jgi:hypothetical protein
MKKVRAAVVAVLVGISLLAGTVSAGEPAGPASDDPVPDDPVQFCNRITVVFPSVEYHSPNRRDHDDRHLHTEPGGVHCER